jgi:hypothetical protein
VIAEAGKVEFGAALDDRAGALLGLGSLAYEHTDLATAHQHATEALAPLWIRNVAAFNPLSYAVDAARSLFNGALGDVSVLRGFGVLTLLALLATWWAAQSFRQATA